MWNAAKAEFRKNFIVLNSYIRQDKKNGWKNQWFNLLQETRKSIGNSTEERRRKKIIKIKFGNIISKYTIKTRKSW